MFMEREGEGDEREGDLSRQDSFLIEPILSGNHIQSPQTRYIKATFSLCESSKNNVVLKRLFQDFLFVYQLQRCNNP